MANNQPLTLKYRPQSFKDLVGNEFTKTILLNSIKEGKIRHGYFLAGGRGCLTLDTPVLSERGFEAIENIKVGDKILGTEVTQTYQPYMPEKLLRLRVESTLPIELTPNHPVLVKRAVRVPTHANKTDVIRRTVAKWIPAEEIQPGDYVQVSFEHKFDCPFRTNPSRALLAVIARYISDGHLEFRYAGHDTPKTVSLSFGERHKEDIERYVEYIKKLGYTPHVTSGHKSGPNSHLSDSTTTIIDISSQDLAYMFREQFGYRSEGKRIPGWLLSLPKEDIEFFLSEFADSTSTATYKGYQSYRFSSINKNVFLGILYMNFRLGYTGQVRVIKPGRAGSLCKHDCYEFLRSAQHRSGRHVVTDKDVWLRVRGIEDVEPKEVVNLTTADHTLHSVVMTHNSGKTTSARILAKALNCTNSKDGEPCCECPSCKAIEEGKSLDLIEIDAASENSVSAIRALIAKLDYAPAMSKHKVVILDECHMLTAQAANALLKTLEEPQPYVVFILCTTDPQKVIETIKSRCLCFQYQRLTTQEISDRLEYICQQEAIKYEKPALDAIAKAVNGGMRDAVTLTDQASLFNNEVTVDTVSQILSTIPTTELQQFFAYIQDEDASIKWLNKHLRRNSPQQVIQAVLDFINRLLQAKSQVKTLDKSVDENKQISVLATNLSYQKLADFTTTALRTLREFREFQLTDNSLLLMKMYLQFVGISKGETVKATSSSLLQTFTRNKFEMTTEAMLRARFPKLTLFKGNIILPTS